MSVDRRTPHVVNYRREDGGKAAVQRQIGATDRQIDRLVYELYDLTEEEIKIFEQATA